jgi:hypothetical protein
MAMNNDLPLSERPAPDSPAEHCWGPGRYPGRHYPFYTRRIVWAGALIIAGLVFLAQSTGYLPQVSDVGPWNWIALGVGVLLLGEWFMHAVSGAYSYHSKGNLIMAGVLIAIGLSGLVDKHYIWPLIIIAVGITSLLGTLFRRF